MIQRRITVDGFLSFIHSYYDDGLFEKALKELRRAREEYPDDLTLVEWEAVMASDEERFHAALECLDVVLARDPGRAFALREKASALNRLGRFDDALELLERVGPDREDDAAYYFDLGHCYDRLGDQEKSDCAYQKAAAIDPEGHAMPSSISRQEFTELLTRAFDDLPPELSKRLNDAAVIIEDFPGPLARDPYRLVKLEAPRRTIAEARGRAAGSESGETLFVYKRALEVEFPDRELLREELTKAVMDELPP